MYQKLLEEKGVDGERYTKHRLKERLKNFFGDEIDFFQARRCKSEIVFPSSLSIQELINNAAEDSKGKNDKELSSASCRDAIWAMLRIDPSHLLDVTPVDGATCQIVPSWSAFNAILYPDIPCITNIGYCPLLDASSTEFSTIYTVMKHAEKIIQSVGQSETVITFDLAI